MRKYLCGRMSELDDDKVEQMCTHLYKDEQLLNSEKICITTSLLLMNDHVNISFESL